MNRFKAWWMYQRVSWKRLFHRRSVPVDLRPLLGARADEFTHPSMKCRCPGWDKTHNSPYNTIEHLPGCPWPKEWCPSCQGEGTCQHCGGDGCKQRDEDVRGQPECAAGGGQHPTETTG